MTKNENGLLLANMVQSYFWGKELEKRNHAVPIKLYQIRVNSLMRISSS